MEYRGYTISEMHGRFLVVANGSCDYEQEPFDTVDDAKAKIDRHLDSGEPFRLGEESDAAYQGRLVRCE